MRELRKWTNDADLHQLRVNLERINNGENGFVNGDFSDVCDDYEGALRCLMGADLVITIAERTPRETAQGRIDLAWFKTCRDRIAQAISDYEASEEAAGMGYAGGPECFEPRPAPRPQLGESHGAGGKLAISRNESLLLRVAKRLAGVRVAA